MSTKVSNGDRMSGEWLKSWLRQSAPGDNTRPPRSSVGVVTTKRITELSVECTEYSESKPSSESSSGGVWQNDLQLRNSKGISRLEAKTKVGINYQISQSRLKRRRE